LAIDESLENFAAEQNYSAEEIAPLKEIASYHLKNSPSHDNRAVLPDEESEQASGSSSPTWRP
jgi:hypothetical protein